MCGWRSVHRTTNTFSPHGTACRGDQAQGVIIVPEMDRNLCSGPNAKLLQKFSQPAVALINALHRITAARLRFGEQQQATLTLSTWRLRSGRIAVRTRPPASQFAREHGLEVARSEEHTSELQSLRHLVC